MFFQCLSAAGRREGSWERVSRFSVRSLGWVQIAEEDLTPERSSRAVNKCIVDLSLGRGDVNDAVGRWGDVSTPLYHDILFQSRVVFITTVFCHCF